LEKDKDYIERERERERKREGRKEAVYLIFE